MINQSTKLHHLFVVIAILNLLIYFWLPPSPAWNLNVYPYNIFYKRQIIYAVSITIIITLIWYSYIKTRKRLTSDKLILLHILFVILIISLIPGNINLDHYELKTTPRRYYSYSTYSPLTGVTHAFIIKVAALLLSEMLLLLNIRKRLKKANA